MPVTQKLTYFIELPGEQLLRLLTPQRVRLLAETGASISMAMLDLSSERREALQLLSEHGVGATAWLVLEPAQGYWLTADNTEQARQRYREVHRWLSREGLQMEALGLDLETPQDDMQALLKQGRRALMRLIHRRRSKKLLREARQQYSALVEEIRRDGYRVETYQFPLILDERRTGSTLLQRIFGFVDLPADREVLMTYESLLPHPLCDAMIDSFGTEAQAIAVGVTGGGVEFLDPLFNPRRLDLHRLIRSLRRAKRYTDHLYIFSLEGCVEGGYFERLCEADLSLPAPRSRLLLAGAVLRSGLRTLLRSESVLDLLQN